MSVEATGAGRSKKISDEAAQAAERRNEVARRDPAEGAEGARADSPEASESSPERSTDPRAAGAAQPGSDPATGDPQGPLGRESEDAGEGDAGERDAEGQRKKTKGKEKEAKEKEAEPRLGRLRWKKKELPGGLWLKCESCEKVIYRKELEKKRMVCPACGFHFTLPGRERLRLVLDEGSFEERYADLQTLDRLGFTDKVPYSEKIERTVQRTGQKEALICGLGTIEQRPVVIAVLDFTFLGGSMGEVVGEKFALSCELAAAERRPLVVFTSSGGARMHEGMLSLMQMAKTCAALATLAEHGGFSICVMTNPTTGGVTASFASVCDIVLAEPGALIGFAGPRVIATTIKQELPPGFQRAEFLLEKGQIDALVTREELRSTLARLIDYGRACWDR